jgi:hypothetical protein
MSINGGGAALIGKFFVMLDLEKTFNFRQVRSEPFGRRIDGSGKFSRSNRNFLLPPRREGAF